MPDNPPDNQQAPTDAAHLAGMADDADRRGIDSRAMSSYLREFRQTGRNEVPAVLLRAASELDALPWMAPAQLSAWLRGRAADAEGALGRGSDA